MLMSAVLRYFRTVFLLLLVTCSCPLFRSSLAASNALHNLGDFTYPYSSIFSPLLKALSEHGGSRWSPGLRKKMKPEHKYMKYLTEVYKKSSRVQRSVDGNKVYNTVRLIKPQDECLALSNKESFMQDLSYSLDQVRRKEQLLKSALLYSFDHDHVSPVNSVCYLSLKEQEHSNQCRLCPGVHHTVNFTVNAERRSRRDWLEVDVTTFLRPLLKFQKKNIHLFINVTCPDGDGHKGQLKFTLRSPPLLLYLNDTSKVAHQRFLVSAKAGQRPATAANTFHKQMVFKPEQRAGRKRRWKRESSKIKRGDKSLDIHLPELLPSSEFPTSDCALYDFRVRFSQLKLDHWIVFPPKYNPRYCRGICPRTMGFIYGSPVHTMVQNIIYEKLDSSVPRPSCIPSHYSPLSVMIFEEDGSYVYKEFEDMVATRLNRTSPQPSSTVITGGLYPSVGYSDQCDVTPVHQVAVTPSVLAANRRVNKKEGRRNFSREHCREAARSNMGHRFGDLAKVRHIITYSLSPFEQRAFPNYFSKGIPNVWRRFTASFFKVAPPMTLMYLTYTWGNSVHEQGKRKNLADFENEE